MNQRNRINGLVAGLLLLGVIVGCGGGDPREAVLAERLKWNVNIKSWTVSSETGRLMLSVGVSGPPSSRLDHLSFKTTVIDAAQNPLREDWHVLDLSEFPRGTPRDTTLTVEPIEGAEGFQFDIVAVPTAADETHIRELQGLGG